MSLIQALALGSYSQVKYHPFEGVDRQLQEILAGEAEVQCSEDFNLLNPDKLKTYRLLISYAEFSDEPVSDEQTAALLSYVAGGGGLLVIHNGISLQRRPELSALIGARFTGHPPFGPLPVTVKEKDHPVMEGIGSFTMEEEPYYFELGGLLKPDILAEYEHDGALRPAVWCHAFGLGRVLYLMPGHHLPSFHEEPFRRMIRQGARWCAGGTTEG